jgi:hypothetical protein
LINLYYQGTRPSTKQYEVKQRQQIQNVLSDFENTAKFTRDQLKNFNSPKNTTVSNNTAASTGTNPIALIMQRQSVDQQQRTGLEP